MAKFKKSVLVISGSRRLNWDVGSLICVGGCLTRMSAAWFGRRLTLGRRRLSLVLRPALSCRPLLSRRQLNLGRWRLNLGWWRLNLGRWRLNLRPRLSYLRLHNAFLSRFNRKRTRKYSIWVSLFPSFYPSQSGVFQKTRKSNQSIWIFFQFMKHFPDNLWKYIWEDIIFTEWKEECGNYLFQYISDSECIGTER